MEAWSLGFTLIFVGIIIVIIGMLLLFFSAIDGKSGEVEGGAVIVIGPIPIVFGTSKSITAWLLVLAAAVFAFMILLYVYAQKTIQ